MRRCGDAVTLFNARATADGGRAWVSTVLRGVSWHYTDQVAVDAAKGGLVAAGRLVLRIPLEVDAGGRTYADPAAYAAGDAAGRWTLAGGDVIVRGEVPDREDGWTPAALRKACPECATVLAVTDNTRARHAPHWRVTGE